MAKSEAWKTICIVTPSEPERCSLVSLLGDLGHAISSFSSAEALLAGLDDAGPRCVIANVDLPGLSGFELLEALELRPARVPTILIGRQGTVHHAVRALRRGARDYFDKPLRHRALRRAVAAIVNVRTRFDECS